MNTKQALEFLGTRSKGPARASDVATDDALELLCRNAPQQAFELALDTFARVAEATRAMVEEQAVDLALREAQRMEIDRKQAENWVLLREPVGQEVWPGRTTQKTRHHDSQKRKPINGNFHPGDAPAISSRMFSSSNATSLH
jgi:hypothetical protein